MTILYERGISTAGHCELEIATADHYEITAIHCEITASHYDFFPFALKIYLWGSPERKHTLDRSEPHFQ